MGCLRFGRGRVRGNFECFGVLCTLCLQKADSLAFKKFNRFLFRVKEHEEWLINVYAYVRIVLPWLLLSRFFSDTSILPTSGFMQRRTQKNSNCGRPFGHISLRRRVFARGCAAPYDSKSIDATVRSAGPGCHLQDLYEKQIKCYDQFCNDLEECCAASNDFVRMSDKCEEIVQEI